MTILHSPVACRAARAEDRRRHLIDVARKLFTEHGFHATGVAQIAAASGIRVGQIYRDFSAKEDIVAAIVAVDLADFLDEAGLRAAVATRDADAIRDWIGRFVRFDDPIEECRLMTEIAAEAARNDRIAAIQRDTDVKINALLATALEALAPGADRAAEREGIVSLILVLGMGLMYRRLVDPAGEAAVTRRIEALLDRELGELLG
ncbi:TetR/AcrR family transcriptional regulator [Sphingomonas rubra]|uniref:Transcriptional regulator, TetR family n=1 Tax=Sphingomonas rubra TaxID=634430 RepID=A0A1I5TL68_9SPHN|nr:TetR/AcrR family transcriptional regulator [Sphingomonas rubra]SFP83785.1 transcriptional regulator, TetR family [Sphingomonas rubra]